MVLDIQLTNFPNGVTSFGVPCFGVGDVLPFTGKYLWVNETLGNDGNPGTPSAPLGTLAAAYAQCTSGNNDVIFITGSLHPTASLTWAKNQTHLIGLSNALMRGKRARISVTGTTAYGPLVDVTATGCLFANFGTFFGWSNASSYPIAWTDEGGRNTYDTVEFMGFGDQTASTGTANLTTARAFKLNTSTGETTFRNCVFGVDTQTRNATNYTIEIAGGAPRVTFENCDFEAYLGSSGTGASHVLIGASGIDRYMNFKGCRFMNSTGSGASTMAQVFNVSSSAGGMVLLDRCTAFGATHWETSASGRVLLDMGAPVAHDGGLAVAASPS